MSDDLRVLLRPAATYRQLARVKGAAAWKRPLFFALLVGCSVSLAISQRVTLRLVVPGAVYGGLIPLLEIAVLWLLLRSRATVPWKRSVDLFFMGHIVWSLWLLMLAAIFAFADPLHAYAITGTVWRWSTIGAAILWSGYIDYCFFRCVSPARAGRNLLVQRVVCWTLGLAIVGGGSLWTGLLGILGT